MFKLGRSLKIFSGVTMVLGTSSSILAGAVNGDEVTSKVQAEVKEGKKFGGEKNDYTLEEILWTCLILLMPIAWLVTHKLVARKDLGNIVAYRDRVVKDFNNVKDLLRNKITEIEKSIEKEQTEIENLNLQIGDISVELDVKNKTVEEVSEIKRNFCERFGEDKEKYASEDKRIKTNCSEAKADVYEKLVEFTKEIAGHDVGDLGKLGRFEALMHDDLGDEMYECDTLDDYIRYGEAVLKSFDALVFEALGDGLADTGLGTIETLYDSESKEDAGVRTCCSNFVEAVKAYIDKIRKCKAMLSSSKYEKINKFYDSVITKKRRLAAASTFFSFDKSNKEGRVNLGRALAKRVKALKEDCFHFGENISKFHGNYDLEKKAKELYGPLEKGTEHTLEFFPELLNNLAVEN